MALLETCDPSRPGQGCVHADSQPTLPWTGDSVKSEACGSAKMQQLERGPSSRTHMQNFSGQEWTLTLKTGGGTGTGILAGHMSSEHMACGCGVLCAHSCSFV